MARKTRKTKTEARRQEEPRREDIVYVLNTESEGYKYIKDLYDHAPRVDVTGMTFEEIKKRFF